MIGSAHVSGGGDVLSKDWLLPRPAETTIFRELPEGGVLFSTASEIYFGVNGVGARIWALLPPASRSFHELCARLATEYQGVDAETIRTDASRFLTHLLANGLVVANPEESSSDVDRP